MALSPRAYASGSDTIRIGLVGCGGRGSGAVGDALAANENARLVAMGDVFGDMLHSHLRGLKYRFQAQPERVDVKPEHMYVGFDAYQKVLASPIDVVILATPPGFRPIHFEAAVKAGKNIFRRSRWGSTARASRVLAANEHAKAKNLKVGVGLQRHHEPKYIETIDRIKSGAIGDVLAMRVYWNDWEFGSRGWRARRPRPKWSTRCATGITTRGSAETTSSNSTSIISMWATGSRGTIRSAVGASAGGKSSPTNATARSSTTIAWNTNIATERGCTASAGTSRTLGKSVTEHAVGTKGTSEVDEGLIVSGATKWKHKSQRHELPYQFEHADLFAAIRENRPTTRSRTARTAR